MTDQHDLDCVDFQARLPEFFASGNRLASDPTMQQHLETCKNCAALVQDLQYIADQARLLLEPAPDQGPSDNVWANIQSKLKEPDPNPE